MFDVELTYFSGASTRTQTITKSFRLKREAVAWLEGAGFAPFSGRRTGALWTRPNFNARITKGGKFTAGSPEARVVSALQAFNA